MILNTNKFLFIVICLLTLTTQAKAQEAYKIFNKTGKEVKFEDLISAAKGKSHIFFGEYHNNPIAHWLQLELTKKLHDQHKANLVVGAEMFEADIQLLINEYFADQIKQKSFEEEARLWKNYKTDYKPILEFAKKNNLKFVATNIPRRYANSVFHNGLEILNTLTPQAKAFIAPLPFPIDSTLSSYKEISKMGQGHNGRFMLEAQAVKDATMAHFILESSAKNTVFLHLNGSYHSNKYEGIIPFILPHVNLNKILVISTITQKNIVSLETENHNLADFIICVNEDMTVTH